MTIKYCDACGSAIAGQMTVSHRVKFDDRSEWDLCGDCFKKMHRVVEAHEWQVPKQGA